MDSLNNNENSFIIISENLSAGWQEVEDALERKDSDYLVATAKTCLENGASAINVGGACRTGNERDNLLWMLEIVSGEINIPLCIDTPEPEILEEAIKIVEKNRNRREEKAPDDIPLIIINSISGEAKKYSRVVELAVEYGAGVIALALDDEGIPESGEDRVRKAGNLVERLLADGIPEKRIFVDPLVMPAGVEASNGPAVLESVRQIRATYPELRITCGLSNISHSLPCRELLNRTFLPMLLGAGLDSAIMDTSDNKLMAALRSSIALMGRDKNFAGYISAYRRKELDD